MIEGEIIAGRHFPNKKPKHILVALLGRYVQDIMPRKTSETQRSHRAVVVFWQERLGHKLLTDITKADMIALFCLDNGVHLTRRTPHAFI